MFRALLIIMVLGIASCGLAEKVSYDLTHKSLEVER